MLAVDSWRSAMIFYSILFEGPDRCPPQAISEAPAFFMDFNLDQIVDAITADWKSYDLGAFYYAGLNDLNDIAHRQEVMQDLEDKYLMETVRSFSGRMRAMRQQIEQANSLSHYKHAMERVFLGAVGVYCQAVDSFSKNLCALDIKSIGLRTFREYLTEYVATTSFRDLVTNTENLTSDLSDIRYSVLMRDSNVTVGLYNGEINYSTAVESTFQKFRTGTAGHDLVENQKWGGMNHIQGQILDRVALLHPEVFRSLDTFYAAHAKYADQRILQFDREIQFYVAYLTYLEKFRRAGLNFCYPELSRVSKEVRAREAFDLALAGKLVPEGATVVCNDFHLSGAERVFVVSGPNQGGKTTFARMFGQLHYLAILGCPVPGVEARLFLFDQLFTHFERVEDIANLRGKLQDDLIRVHQILEQATSNSLVVMNEMFSSTTLKDAIFLSKRVLARISALDLVAVCVTFLDELASFNEKTVSVVSTVDPNDPAIRTYKLERRSADGLAYALAIAQKHRVTYDLLKERIEG
jgi:DNA mismatch repair protein MutS